VGTTVNQTELAAIFGVSDVTIWEWQKDGLPMLARGPNGTANQYDTEACIAWYAAREVAKVTKETHRDRLTRLQADALELELEERRAILVPVDQVEPVWQARVFAAAAFLLGQPSRLAGMLEGTPGIEAKREVLRKEFNGFLTKLGVDGEVMQADVQRMLERLSEQDAADLLARLTKGHDGSPDAPDTAEPRVAGARPDPADPAVGVG
jgi:phage terminase Nu1 subunit (DNA packaging protein)